MENAQFRTADWLGADLSPDGSDVLLRADVDPYADFAYLSPGDSLLTVREAAAPPPSPLWYQLRLASLALASLAANASSLILLPGAHWTRLLDASATPSLLSHELQLAPARLVDDLVARRSVIIAEAASASTSTSASALHYTRAVAQIMRGAVPCAVDGGAGWAFMPHVAAMRPWGTARHAGVLRWHLRGGCEAGERIGSGGGAVRGAAGTMVASTGAAGARAGAPLLRFYGAMSNDKLMLHHGVAVLGNVMGSVVIEGVFGQLLGQRLGLGETEGADAAYTDAAVDVKKRNAPTDATEATEATEAMEVAEATEAMEATAEVSSAHQHPPQTHALLERMRSVLREAKVGDVAMFVRDADRHGPTWPGIPGPDVCDLQTMLLARWAVDVVGTVRAAGVPAGDANQRGEELAELPAFSLGRYRQPKPFEEELAAWQLLVSLIRATLASLPSTLAADEAKLSQTIAHEPILTYRVDQKRLLLTSVARLERCIAASRERGVLVLEAGRHEVEEAGAGQAHAQQCERRVGEEEKSCSGESLDGSTFLAPTSTASKSAATSASTPASVILLPLPRHILQVPAPFQAQAARMPPLVRSLLVDGGDTDLVGVRPMALFAELLLSEEAFRDAERGATQMLSEAVLQRREVLGAAECQRLRGAVDAGQTTNRDTVDGAPDHQLNLNGSAFAAVVGAEAAGRVDRVARDFAVRMGGLELGPGAVFVRRYSRDTRPWIPFHCDSATVTVNIALNSDVEDAAGGAEEGGKLLVACEGAMRCVSRREGDATVHSSGLLHGVSSLRGDGARYSLIVFYREVAPREAGGGVV